MPRKGMIASVYRPADGHDSTNGGVSSQAFEVLVVGEGIPEIFEDTGKRPALLYVDRGRIPPCLYPLGLPGEPPPSHLGFMFGGNFAYSCDSRWPGNRPIKIHDRQEGR